MPNYASRSMMLAFTLLVGAVGCLKATEREVKGVSGGGVGEAWVVVHEGRY